MFTPESLVGAGLFPDEQSVIREAVRVLWQERPTLRIEWAIHQYRNGGISLSRAAALAGVGFDKMKELLVQRGIQPRLGAETREEATLEMKNLERALMGKS